MRYPLSFVGLSLCGVAFASPKLPPLPPPANDTQRRHHIAALEGTPENQIKALTELLASGKNGPYVPLLLHLLQTTESPNVRQYVTQALTNIGPDAKDALPELRKQFREYGNRNYNFASAIVAIGDGNDPDIIRWLCLANSEGRSKSPISLRPALEKHPNTVIPILGHFLSEDDRNLHLRVLRQLKSVAVPREAKSPMTTASSPLIALPTEARAQLLQQLRTYCQKTELQRNNVYALACAAEIALRMDPTLFDELLPIYLLRLPIVGIEHNDFVHLVQAHPAAADRLIAHFNDPHENFRHQLMNNLRNVNTPAMKQALARGLQHDNPLVRDGVLQTIQFADTIAKALAPRVTALLHDTSPQVRLRAATILRQHQPQAIHAFLPVFAELAESPTKTVRHSALVQLTAIGPKARTVRPVLMRLIHHSQAETRFLAAEALFAADPTTTATVMRPFADGAADTRSEHCERAIKHLGKCGPAAKSMLASLKPAMDFHDLRIHASYAMWQIDPTCFNDIVEVLKQALTTVDSECELVLDLLPKFGPAAKPLIPALKSLMHNEDDDEYAAKAATAVIMLDPKDADEAYLMFRGVLSNTRSASTLWLRQMRELGPAAKPLLPELTSAIRSPRPNTRRYAIETLGVLGADAKEALPVLREAAKATPNIVYLDEAIKKIEGLPKR